MATRKLTSPDMKEHEANLRRESAAAEAAKAAEDARKRHEQDNRPGVASGGPRGS